LKISGSVSFTGGDGGGDGIDSVFSIEVVATTGGGEAKGINCFFSFGDSGMLD